jgi:hypothetical protein
MTNFDPLKYGKLVSEEVLAFDPLKYGKLVEDEASQTETETVFDPEGPGYDMESAKSAELQPDETGHWPSRNPKTGQLLKGKKHETWDLLEKGENEAGYKIEKREDGKYYSTPGYNIQQRKNTLLSEIADPFKEQLSPAGQQSMELLNRARGIGESKLFDKMIPYESKNVVTSIDKTPSLADNLVTEGDVPLKEIEMSAIDRTKRNLFLGAEQVTDAAVSTVGAFSDYFAALDKKALSTMPEEARNTEIKRRQELSSAGKAVVVDKEELMNISKNIEDFKAQSGEQFAVLPERKGIQKFTDDIVKLAPQIFSTAAVYGVTGGAGSMLFMGSQILGGKYDKLMYEDDVEPIRAFQASLADASAQSALETIGLVRAFKMWKPSVKTTNLLNETATVLGVEWFTEFIQSFSDSATDIWGKAKKEGKDLSAQFDQFVHDFVSTARQGAYEGLVTLPFAGLPMAAKVAVEKLQDMSIKNTKVAKDKFIEGMLDQAPNIFENVVEQTKDLPGVKEEEKTISKDIAVEIPSSAETVKEVKTAKAKVVNKKPVKTLDAKITTFIDSNIVKLGSLEAVKKLYNLEDDVSAYARTKAAEVYGGEADVDKLTPKVKSTPLSTGYDIQGKGFDTQKGKLIPYAKEWIAKKDMKVAARKAGADVSEYDVFEQDGGWVFQRREIEVPGEEKVVKFKVEKPSSAVIKLVEEIKNWEVPKDQQVMMVKMLKDNPYYHSPSLKKELGDELTFVEPKSEIAFIKNKKDIEKVNLPDNYIEVSLSDLLEADGLTQSTATLEDRIRLSKQALDLGADVVMGGSQWIAVNPKIKRTKVGKEVVKSDWNPASEFAEPVEVIKPVAVAKPELTVVSTVKAKPAPSKKEIDYKTVKPEAQEVFDVLNMPEQSRDKLKRKKKVRVIEHNITPEENVEIPATWHDGVFRYTAARTPDGKLMAGEAGSYDTILMPGHVAGSKSGKLRAGHTLYLFDTGVGTDTLRIYRVGPEVKQVETPEKPKALSREELRNDRIEDLKDGITTFGKGKSQGKKLQPWTMEHFAQKFADKQNETELGEWKVEKIGDKKFVVKKVLDDKPPAEKSKFDPVAEIDKARRPDKYLDYSPNNVYSKQSIKIFNPTEAELKFDPNADIFHFIGSMEELKSTINADLTTTEAVTGDKYTPITKDVSVYVDLFYRGFNRLQFIDTKYGKYFPVGGLIDLNKASSAIPVDPTLTVPDTTVGKNIRPPKTEIIEESKLPDEVESKVFVVPKNLPKIVSTAPVADTKVKDVDLYGTGEAVAGMDLTSGKARLLKDVLGYNPVRTIIGELVQNSFDAMRGYTDKPLTVYVNNGIMAVRDFGKGMTPAVIRNDFINLFAQGTKGAEDLGGFGFAKLPIMGWPDSFYVVSVAVDPVTGNKALSKVWGTREDYMIRHKLGYDITPISNDTPTGTLVVLKRGKEDGYESIRPDTVESIALAYGDKLRTGQSIRLITDKKDYTDLDILDSTPSADAKALVMKTPGWNDIPSMYTKKEFSLNGSDIEVKFVKSEVYGYGDGPYKLALKVYNKGLLLPDIPQYSSIEFMLPRKPNFTIEVNFTKTPDAGDTKNYPFLVNRTRLTTDIESKIKKEVQDVINDIRKHIGDENKKDILRVFNSAPEFGGTKVIIPYKDPMIYKDVAEVLSKYPDMFKALGTLYKNFSKVLAKETDIPIHNYALTTAKNLHGFRPPDGVLPVNYIVSNPFSYLDKKYGGKGLEKLANDKVLRSSATGFIDTLIHEAAHTNAKGHYDSFMQEFHRLHKDLDYQTVYNLSEEAYGFFKKHQKDIESVTRSLSDVQKSGAFSPAFSDYIAEQRRIERRSVDEARREDVERVEGSGGITLTSGFDPIQAVKAIHALGKDIKSTIPQLEALGKHFYTGGKQRYFDWQKKMRAALGDLWEKVKKYIAQVWKNVKQSTVAKPLMNQRGSVRLPVDEIIRTAKQTVQQADYVLGILSTRAGNISKAVDIRVQKFEWASAKKAEDIKEALIPYIEATESMTGADYKAYDLARKNANVKEIARLEEKYEMNELSKDHRAILDVLRDEAIAVGHETGYIKGYHPRQVLDYDGLLDYLYKNDKDGYTTIDLLIKKQEKKLKRTLNEEEKIKLVNKLYRGFSSGGLTLSKPGQLKARSIKVITLEMSKYFANSNSALIRYVYDVVSAVEARKLFGRRKGDALDLNETIGAYVYKLSKEEGLSPAKERELRAILQARFNAVGTSGIMTTLKNLAVIDVMGSWTSALRQVGDLGFAMYNAGMIGSAMALPKAVVGQFKSLKELFGESRLTKKTAGISGIAAEFSDKSTSAKAVDFVFKKIWLTKIDAVGKEVLMNAAFFAARKQLRTQGGEAEFRKEYEPVFGKHIDDLINDIRNDNISEHVEFFGFYRLAKFQPINLWEMPQGFVEGGNYRILYMLKSFDIKRFDVYRREVFQKIGSKDAKTRLIGLKNLFRLAFYLTLMQATGDMLIDLLLGKPVDLKGTVLESIMGLAISRYTAQKVRREGPGALLKQLTPPTQIYDSMFKDLFTIGDNKGLEVVKSVPFVGKIYYNRFGKGAKRNKVKLKPVSTNAIREARKSRKVENTKRKVYR